jgi:hypothetical protein
MRCWLFRSLSTLPARAAYLFSFSILPFIDKQAELTEKHFSNPNTLPMSVNLCRPKIRHKYIAIARAVSSQTLLLGIWGRVELTPLSKPLLSRNVTSRLLRKPPGWRKTRSGSSATPSIEVNDETRATLLLAFHGLSLPR